MTHSRPNTTPQHTLRHWIFGLCLILTISQGCTEETTVWDEYTENGDQLLQQGKYPEAEKEYTAALEEAKKENSQTPRLAKSLNKLAVLHDTQGEYEKAEQYLTKIVEIYKKGGKSHKLDLATTLSNLGAVHYAQEQYDKARPLFHQAIEMREQELGQDHKDLVNDLKNLAGLHARQQEYEQAEPYLKRALSIIEKTSGPDSTN